MAADEYAARLSGLDPSRPVADAAQLASPPPGSTLAEVVSDVQAAAVPSGFTGYLADELRNVTFPGERDAATDTFRAYAEVEANGGTDPATFARFDDALARTLTINQSAFDASVGQGLSATDGLQTWSAVAVTIIAVAAFVGLRPRLKEYAA